MIGLGKKWDDRFMQEALVKASWSKDKSRKVGCVIVGLGGEIRSSGYNGFPRGVNDDISTRHERPAKYWYTVHAEINAICNASRVGISLEKSTIYMPWYPCAQCAGAIVQAGISDAVLVEPDWNDPKYGGEFMAAKEMLVEGGVRVRFVEGYEPPKQQVLT